MIRLRHVGPGPIRVAEGDIWAEGEERQVSGHEALALIMKHGARFLALADPEIWRLEPPSLQRH